jgi:hypothetical protein
MQILKGNYRKNVGSRNLIETSGSDFGDFAYGFDCRIEYVGELEAIYETALESGTWGDCLMKKTEDKKFRDTVPLRRGQGQ